MEQTKAIVYPAAERKRLDMETYRSFRCTITPDKPFLNLIGVWDDTLAPGASTHYIAQTGHLFIPLVGDIVTTQRLSRGQAQMVSGVVEVRNPHETELVNYIHLVFKTKVTDDAVAEFDLDRNKGKIINLFPGVYIAGYEGVSDDVYKLNAGAKGVFVFVLAGTFEVQDHFLHKRDGLALSDVTEFELESFVPAGTLLIVEVS